MDRGALGLRSGFRPDDLADVLPDPTESPEASNLTPTPATAVKERQIQVRLSSGQCLGPTLAGRAWSTECRPSSHRREARNPAIKMRHSLGSFCKGIKPACVTPNTCLASFLSTLSIYDVLQHIPYPWKMDGLSLIIWLAPRRPQKMNWQ